MIPLPSKLCTRFLTAAAFALTVAVVFAPGKGRAGCGDYVTIGGKPAPMADHPLARPEGDTSQPAAPKPCQGPNCSQHPSMPLSPPSAPTVSPGDWACLLTQLSDSFRLDEGTVRDVFSFQPVQRIDSI